MKKSKNKSTQKKIILYTSIIVFAILLILGAYLLIKGKQIREGKVVDCGKGTAIYLNERLCWQETAWDDRAENWQDANDYCGSLNLADHEDWRLPTREELLSLVKENPAGVDIDEEVFKGTEEIQYWTSTEYKEGMHWYVHFEKGHEGYSQNFNANYGVRCVRDTLFY